MTGSLFAFIPSWLTVVLYRRSERFRRGWEEWAKCARTTHDSLSPLRERAARFGLDPTAVTEQRRLELEGCEEGMRVAPSGRVHLGTSGERGAQPDGIHTIPVPSGWSAEQAWEAISRGDLLSDSEPSWVNVVVKDGKFVELCDV